MRNHRSIFFGCLLLLFVSSLMVVAQKPSRRSPIVAVVEEVGPAIVSISTETLTKGKDPTDVEALFNDFFESQRPPSTFKTHSLGSGILVDSEGFILTNEHVIQRASKITIVLSNKNQYEAFIVASDAKNDLALLKIKASAAFPCVKMGNSAEIMMGETVIALGNPFGLQNTVTTGIISAMNRTLEVKGAVHFHDFLQTDAAINPGNSGGALLNIHGELIGMNIALYSKGYGLGFAVPVNRLRKMLGALLDYQKLKKQGMGITVEEIDSEKLPWLVRVTEVNANSPAARAGIVVGDILYKADSTPIECLFDFHKVMYLKEVGESVKLEVLSSNLRRRTLSLTVASLETNQGEQSLLWETIGIVPLQIQGGILVRNVRPRSSAERIGITRGDLIVSLEGYPIRTVEELLYVLSTKERGVPLNIVILRDGRRLGGNLIKE